MVKLMLDWIFLEGDTKIRSAEMVEGKECGKMGAGKRSFPKEEEKTPSHGAL